MLFMGRDIHLLAGHDNELRPYIANGIVFARLVKRSSAEEMICRMRKYDRGITLVGVIYLAGVAILLCLSLQLHADDMADSYNRMCDKMKSCAM
jgi:hypothetical protein